MSGIATYFVYDQKTPQSPRATSPESDLGLPDMFRKIDDKMFISAQPANLDELQNLIKQLKSQCSTHSSRKIMFLDLRQETHFYVDGVAVSVFAGNNEVNKGLSTAQVLAKENAFVGDLNAYAKRQLTIYRLCKNSENIKVPQFPTVIDFDSVTTEQEEVAKIAASLRFEITYKRVAILDYSVPEPDKVDEILEAAAEVSTQEMITTIHCLGGKGRSMQTTAIMQVYANNGEVLPATDSTMLKKVSSVSLSSFTSFADEGLGIREERARVRDNVSTFMKAEDGFATGIKFSVWFKIKMEALQKTMLPAFSALTLAEAGEEEAHETEQKPEEPPTFISPPGSPRVTAKTAQMILSS